MTRNGGPQFGACLILSDLSGAQANAPRTLESTPQSTPMSSRALPRALPEIPT